MLTLGVPARSCAMRVPAGTSAIARDGVGQLMPLNGLVAPPRLAAGGTRGTGPYAATIAELGAVRQPHLERQLHGLDAPFTSAPLCSSALLSSGAPPPQGSMAHVLERIAFLERDASLARDPPAKWRSGRPCGRARDAARDAAGGLRHRLRHATAATTRSRRSAARWR